MNGLTPLQQAFVYAFDGNIAETARSIDASLSYCEKLMSAPEYEFVRVALWKRIKKERDSEKGRLVATRLERLAFWTEIMRNDAEETKDRLKASELLGKAHLDFAEKHIIEGGQTDKPLNVGVIKGIEERIKSVLCADWLE